MEEVKTELVKTVENIKQKLRVPEVKVAVVSATEEKW